MLGHRHPPLQFALDALAQWFARAPGKAKPAVDEDGKPLAKAKPQPLTTALTMQGAKNDPQHTRWQQEVIAPWGRHAVGGKASYKPTLVRDGQWIVYSPDDALVDLALDALGKRYPSLGDTLPAQGGTLAVFGPKEIADLAQTEAFRVLPPEQEVLHQAARSHLLPRLAALRKLPAARAIARGAPDANGWIAIDWQALAAPAAPAKTASVQ